ncbi:hypothetical protein AVEN_143536-1 [Araneus ventricosus]|uniref:Uncharacterized protein n=1 Tax=Araneus ventricosus TaxID=182803 RepID=A0A4Y2APP9_ARAVE|nr:hypothetical protein AVEN_143536-1 [Araneus ventricosus]
MVSASASEPVDRESHPGLCSYSAFAIVCNASLLQVRPMVTSKLALTCCKLVSHLHSCRVKLAASLQICSASLLQTKIAIWVGYSNPQKGKSRTVIPTPEGIHFQIPIDPASERV